MTYRTPELARVLCAVPPNKIHEARSMSSEHPQMPIRLHLRIANLAKVTNDLSDVTVSCSSEHFGTEICTLTFARFPSPTEMKHI